VLTSARSATFINEGVYQAAAHLAKVSSPFYRRVMIVVTDNHSTQYLPFLGHSEKQATAQLFESGGVVCGLLVRDLLGKMQNVMSKDPRVMLLRKVLSVGSVGTYAKKTGGEVMNANKEEVAVKLAELIDRLRTRYSLGYSPSNVKPDGKFRKLKLSPEAEKREGQPAVLAKQGYYARKHEPAPGGQEKTPRQ
jgi:hypothetical protein